MRKHLSVCGLLLACALTASPQADKKNVKIVNKPDLTGRWQLDLKKSSVRTSDNADLKITYQEPEIRITRLVHHNGQIVERVFTYYTDGRGETNQATMVLSTRPNISPQDVEKQVTKSKTRWSGNKLVTRSFIRNVVAGHSLEFEVIDEWKLSSDGKILTQTSRTVFHPSFDSVFVPANVPETKRVYSRIPY